jgi:hypothetical protein
MLEAPPEPSPHGVAKQRLLRIAWTVVAGGMLIAFGAAVVGGSSPGTDVTVARQLAGVIMLAGLVVVLAAHRIAWLRSVRRQLNLSTPTRQREETYSMRRFLLLGLPAIVTLIIATWVILAIVPTPLAGIMIFAITVLLSSVLLVVAIHGRGYLAAFCLGALVPVLAEMVSLVLLPIAASMNRYPSFSRAIEALGHAVAYTGLVWLAALVSGFVAMGTRALLGPRRSTEDAS